MEKNIKIFDSPDSLARLLAADLMHEINNSSKDFFLGVSGGSTPKILFKELSHPPFKEKLNWSKVQIFWCDERCVPPEDSDSNYGMTKTILLNHINIPPQNIHRIFGESHPEKEAVRYAKEIEKILPEGENNSPRFDWILLGLGSDGHTASLFPNSGLLYSCSNIAGVAIHPTSGQKRISLTEKVINNSKQITFMVTGKDKANILSDIINNNIGSRDIPASKINPTDGSIEWRLDSEAAQYLK